MRLSLFLLVFLAAFAPASAATYIVDGVNPNDVVNSSRFYDAGKGMDWKQDTPNDALAKYWIDYSYNTTDKNLRQWANFGSLAERLKATTQPSYSEKPRSHDETGNYKAYSYATQLMDDSLKCWAYTTSNIISYWQSTYGVFYKGNADLPMGHTYAKSMLAETTGIQSTKVSYEFYKYAYNNGSASGASAALDWWMRGATSGYFSSAPSDNDGYFNEYFTGSQYGYVTGSDLLPQDRTSGSTSWAQAIATALGYKDNGDGTFSPSTDGQIAYVSIGGHAVSCYGFETDDSGELKALYLANSDNVKYSLDKYYIKYREQGDGASNDYHYCLYTDENCTQAWENYFLNSIEYINTPDALKKMYEKYSSLDSVLQWGEGNGTWEIKSETDRLEALPTGEKWQIDASLVSGQKDMYNAYFTQGRKAEFLQATANRAISVKGDIETQLLTITTGEGLTDTLTGEGSNTLTAKDGLKKQGKGIAKLAALKLAEKSSVQVEEGSLHLLNQSGVQLAELVLANGTIFGAYTGSDAVEAQETTLTLGSGSKLTAGSNTQLLANLVLSGATLTLTDGGLTLGSTLSLGTGNKLLVEGGLGERFVLMNGVDSLVLGNATAVTSLSTPVDAHDYFNNLDAGTYNITYSDNTVALTSTNVPETSSTILCLLSLVVGVAHRQRRRSKS